PVRPSGLPAFQRCVLDPQRQAAPPPQARLVGRPVPHLERHLRDVVTAIGVVFVRHREQLEPEREEHPTIPGPAECTNAVPRPSSPSPLRSTQKASSRRNFTPARPDSPATSLRDFLSGAYSGQQALKAGPADTGS